MARYRKIDTRILLDKTYNQLSSDGRLAFLHLLIHPHLTSLGAMHASLAGIACELNWELDRLREAIESLYQQGMVRYDEKARFIWLPNFLKYNPPESPNVVKSWETALSALPECDLQQQLTQSIKAFVLQLSFAYQEALPACFHLAEESSAAPQTVAYSLAEVHLKNPTHLPEGHVAHSIHLKEGPCQNQNSLSEGYLENPQPLSEGVLPNHLPLSEAILEDSLLLPLARANDDLRAEESSAAPQTVAYSLAEVHLKNPTHLPEGHVAHSIHLKEGPCQNQNSLPEGCLANPQPLSEGILPNHLPLSEAILEDSLLLPLARANDDLRDINNINNKNNIYINNINNINKQQEEEKEEEILQEKDLKQIKSIGEEKNIVAPTRQKTFKRPNAQWSDVTDVFAYWQQTLEHPQAKLDDKRRKVIKNALALGYTVTQLQNAIRGCSLTPHNMGENEQGQRYDGLQVILRDADQIDRFIRNSHSPPRLRNAADRLLASNVAAGERWLAMTEDLDE